MTASQISGRVFWVTGLSGAGKTTLATLLYNKLRREIQNVVYLDGDILRSVFGDKVGYTEKERYKLAFQYARLAQMLSEQGLFVVFATISMFDDIWKWNRENISGYREIYIKVPIDVLQGRNNKGIYNKSSKNIVGIGVPFSEPKNADIVISNDGSRPVDEVFEGLLNQLSKI